MKLVSIDRGLCSETFAPIMVVTVSFELSPVDSATSPISMDEHAKDIGYKFIAALESGKKGA